MLHYLVFHNYCKNLKVKKTAPVGAVFVIAVLFDKKIAIVTVFDQIGNIIDLVKKYRVFF